MKKSAEYFETIGNNGGDILEMKKLKDGRIGLKVGHCCVFAIDAIVPPEFITAVLTKAVLDAGGIKEAIRLIGWEPEYINALIEQIEIRG